MDIKPIKNDADYRQALREIESLMDAEADTPEGDRLDIWVTLVEAYEAKHYPLDLPDPVEAIRFAMEQRGLDAEGLEPLLGRCGRVEEIEEILDRKRPITLEMAWRLHTNLGIPAESLLKPQGGGTI
jgi:HTH-type transcriptional regulator/antitoxin HigA